MLQEIKVNELVNDTGLPTYFLYADEGRMVALEDVFDGIRILVDVPERYLDGPGWNRPGPAAERTGGPERKKLTREEMEREILKAWDSGKRNIAEVMEITGCTFATARKYIPVSPEG